MIQPGSGQELDLELVKQVVQEGLLLLSTDSLRMAEVFSRHDSPAPSRQNGPEEYQRESIEAFKRLVSPGPRRDGYGVSVFCHKPESQAQLPLIDISYRGSISESLTLQGDTIDEFDVQIGSKLYRDTIKGSYLSASLEVAVLGTNLDEAYVLFLATAHVLRFHKGRLLVAAVTSIDITTTPPSVETRIEELGAIVGLISLSITLLQRTTTRTGPHPANVTLDF